MNAGQPETPAVDGELAAGEFGRWLDAIGEAIDGRRPADVPCGTCTACCRSAQFVHVGPEEVATLARIPAELLVAAPGLPSGHRVMGYDERGHCPMLQADGCSIYEDRPRTCRTYDCRVFAAAGVEPDAHGARGRTDVAERVRRWRFDYGGAEAHVRQRAVRATAALLARQPDVLGPRSAANPTAQAVAAVLAHRAGLRLDTDGRPLEATAPTAQAVRVELDRRTRAARSAR